MLRDEAVVRDSLAPDRTGERATHGGLSLPTVAEPCNRITLVAKCVATIVHQPLARPVPFDEGPHAVCSPPAVGALPACVGAVEAPSTRTEVVGDVSTTRRARVGADHIADDMPFTRGDR